MKPALIAPRWRRQPSLCARHRPLFRLAVPPGLNRPAPRPKSIFNRKICRIMPLASMNSVRPVWTSDVEPGGSTPRGHPSRSFKLLYNWFGTHSNERLFAWLADEPAHPAAAHCRRRDQLPRSGRVGARGALARVYVKDPKRSLDEIAFLLGYAELSPFLRAFRRWTGMTPRSFRAA